MDSTKAFDIRYTPRKKDSKFILFADLQEDRFGVFDEDNILRFGHEIAKTMLNATLYFEHYDVLYYTDFNVMTKDIEWILKKSEFHKYPFAFHEIDSIDNWQKNAKEFEKEVKNALLLLSHPEYKFTYDLIWR